MHEYRELFFKLYRVMYRVRSDRVYGYLIADGRRDMRELLSRRLLGG
jgi:toxin ParE1/3/4